MKNYFDQFPPSYLEGSKRLLHTPSTVAKEGFFYVQETGYLKLKESPQSKPKQFDSYLIAYVLSGEGTLEYQNERYHLSENSYLFINCQSTYKLQSCATNPWELLWVHFHGATSSTYYAHYASQYAPVFKNAQSHAIQETLHTLLKYNEDQDLYTEVHSSKLIMDLLTLLLLANNQKRDTLNSELIDKLKSVKTYLDNHFTEKIVLDYLAQHFFISKYHLCHAFKEYYGMTINQYIMSLRLSMVKRLLRFSESPIHEISQMCGFYDSSYLNRCFKATEGISLNNYRKKWG